MRKQTLYTLAIVALAVTALAVVLWQRQKAPPEAARLLPESDAIVFASLKPLRAATHFDRTPVARSPGFQQFIDETGIVPERDLDTAAFALHRMADPHGPNGPVAFSEVFEGRFDGQRLGKYLARLASSTESYAGHTIYTVPVEGRSLRVAQLGYDTIAASNMPTTEQIHGMLDRQRASASPFSGSSLLAARYEDVPVLSSAWAIGHLGLPFMGEDKAAGSGRVTMFGLELPFSLDTEFVASLRYTTALHLRVEEIAPTEADAARSAEQLATIFQFLHTLEQTQADTPDTAGLLKTIDSLRIDRKENRAIVTATVPLAVVQTILKPEKP